MKNLDLDTAIKSIRFTRLNFYVIPKRPLIQASSKSLFQHNFLLGPLSLCFYLSALRELALELAELALELVFLYDKNKFFLLPHLSCTSSLAMWDFQVFTDSTFASYMGFYIYI